MAGPNVLITIKAMTAQAEAAIGRVSKSINSMSAAATRASASMKTMGASASQAVGGVRMVAQGVQNLGFVMSAFISLPITAGLKAMADELMSFESAMVEVTKTTGLAQDDVGSLALMIRELAQATPTSATELANLAAAAGRAGIGLDKMAQGDMAGAVEEIFEFVRVVDMMQIATTFTGESGAKAFGKLITVIDKLDSSNIEKMGSAINELGQSTALSEDEIVSTMLRLAPIGDQLGMLPDQIAAVAAAIAQASESPSRGGTRLRVALNELILNWDEAAKLIGLSKTEIEQALDDDALGVLLSVVSALGSIESTLDRSAITAELFGSSGATAIQTLQAMFPELINLIDISSTAWEEGTSLQTEFDRALGSTENQLSILKNTVLEVVKVFGMDLLPIAKDIIGVLIVATKELGKWVATLTTKQKMLGVAIAMVVAVGFPLLAILGSIGFAFSMVIGGLLNVVMGMAGLVGIIVTLGGSVSGLVVILGGAIAVLGTGVVGALLKLTGGLDSVLETLADVASQAREWGGNIVAEIAGGIVSAVATVLGAALQYLGDFIASFLEGHSPPERGPLSTIDQWGKTLIETFIGGFGKADFSMLNEIGSRIKKALNTLLDIGSIGKSDLGPMLAGAREQVALLIDTFNKTGRIASGVLDKLGASLGAAGAEITKLIRLQLQYNGALKDLERIKNKSLDIEEAYSAEIRAIQARQDLSGAEKARLIKDARGRRDLAAGNASTEEKAAQKTVDGLKEQVEWQKQFLDTMEQQDKVWADHMKAVVGAMKGASKAIKATVDKLQDLFDKLKINQEAQEQYDKKGMDKTPLLREELSIRKRITTELLSSKQSIEDQLAELEDGDQAAAPLLKQLGDINTELDGNLLRIEELNGLLETPSDDIVIPGIGEFKETEGFLADLQKGFDGVADSVENWGSKMDTAKQSYDLFILGLTGKEIPKEMFGYLDDSSVKFYTWGEAINNFYLKVKGPIEWLIEKYNLLGGGAEDAAAGMENAAAGLGLVPVEVEFDLTVSTTPTELWEEIFGKDAETESVAALIDGRFAVANERLSAGLDGMMAVSESADAEGWFAQLSEDISAWFDTNYENIDRPDANFVGFFTGDIDALKAEADVVWPKAWQDIQDAVMAATGEGTAWYDFFNEPQLDDRLFSEKIQEFIDGIDIDTEGLKTEAENLWKSFTDYFEEGGGSTEPLWPQIKKKLGLDREPPADFFESTGLMGPQLFEPMWDLQPIITLPEIDWGQVWENMSQPISEGRMPLGASFLLALEGMSDVVPIWSMESLLPKLGEAILQFGTTLEMLATINWPTTMSNALALVTEAISDWVMQDAIPAIGEFIFGGEEEIDLIGTDWVTAAATALDLLKAKFKEKFDAIKALIVATMKAAVNSIITMFETGINRAINAVNDLIEKVNNNLAVFGITDAIPKIGNISIPKLGAGGIATSPLLAVVGDRPEAIIPLDRLDEMFDNNTGGGITIVIENPVVRSDNDLEEIINEVSYRLGSNLRGRYELGGRLMA